MSNGGRLQLSLSGKGFSNLAGLLQKSDPFAVVTVRGDSENNTPLVVGQTEVGEFRVIRCREMFLLSLSPGHSIPNLIVCFFRLVYNNLNPQWSSVIILEGYKFGVPFWIEVGVFDFQAKKIGKKESNLATISSEEGRVITSTESTRNLLRAGKLPHKVMGTALFEVGEVLGSRGNLVSKSLQTGGALYVHVERSRQDGPKGSMKFQLRGLSFSNRQTLGRKSSPFFELFRKVETPSGAVW